MEVGSLGALWRYPVKSLGGEQMTDAPLTSAGVPGDRGYAVVDARTGLVLSAKRTHELLRARAIARPGGPVVVFPDGRARYAADAEAELSELVGRPVRVAAAGSGAPEIEDAEPGGTFFGPGGGGFFDAAPLHLVTSATLGHLSSLAPSTAFDPRRFRPNLVVQTDEPLAGDVEQSWIGARVRVGQVELEVTSTCRRCALTTAAQDELPRDPDVLRTVAQHQRNECGVYARVVEPGLVSVGDRVTVSLP